MLNTLELNQPNLSLIGSWAELKSTFFCCPSLLLSLICRLFFLLSLTLICLSLTLLGGPYLFLFCPSLFVFLSLSMFLKSLVPPQSSLHSRWLPAPLCPLCLHLPREPDVCEFVGCPRILWISVNSLQICEFVRFL